MRTFGTWCFVLLVVAACGGKSATEGRGRAAGGHSPKDAGGGEPEMDASASMSEPEPEPEPEPELDASEPSPAPPEPDDAPAVPVDAPGRPEPVEPPDTRAPPEPAPDPEVDPTLPDAGVPEPAAEPTADPSADPLLAYIGGSSPGIRDARTGSPWFDFQFSISIGDGATPWSRDGSTLIDRRGDALVFFHRTDDGFEQGTSVTLPSTPKRWLGNEGVVAVAGEMAQELWFVLPDGSSELVTDAFGPIVSTAASADGTRLLFDTASEGGFSLYLVTRTVGSPASVAALDAHGNSPMLSQTWSSDGRWLAFGLSGGDDEGIYAYDTLTSGFRRVSPEGASYNPLYTFAPGRNVLALYASLSEPELGVVSLDGDDRSWQVVHSGTDTTPAEWSRDGLLLFHGATGNAELVPVDDAGQPGEPIAFPDGNYGCPLLWISPTQFYQRECGQSELLYLATIDSGTVTRELVSDDALTATVQSPDGRCFANSSTATLSFGGLTPQYIETDRMASESPTAFTFTPDSSGVAWADAVAAHYQPLDDACAPVGDPVTLAGSSNTTSIVFLPE